MATIKFPSPSDGTISTQRTQSIYTRSRWSDAWDLQPALWPLEVTWSVAPTLPVAVIELQYGWVHEPYSTLGLSDRGKVDATGLVGDFVKIEIGVDVTQGDGVFHERYWYGVIAEARDFQGGVDPETRMPHGKVTLIAYGLEKLLADHAIAKSYCTDAALSELVIVDTPIDFNASGPLKIMGNRSSVKVGPTYLFGATPSSNSTWSSKDILEYLVQWHTPTDAIGGIALPIELDLPDKLPGDSDAPILKTQNATTYSLISQILDRRRVTMWWMEVDEELNVVKIKADTMVVAPITGETVDVPANSRQLKIQHDGDQLTNVAVNNSSLPRYDQVVVRGPLSRTIATFSYLDGTIDAGWTAADEAAYEAGGTPHPASTPLKRKQIRNDSARRAPELENVFALFRIPEDWDFQTGDGLGGLKHYAFMDEDGALQKQCYSGLVIEQSMPLFAGVDYSGTRVGAGRPIHSDTDEEMRPLVFFKRPWTSAGSERYQKIDGMVAEVERTESKENERLRCYVSVPQNTMSIRLTVQGQPQHAIAYSDFTPIAGEDKSVGHFDWHDAVFTVAVRSQFHVEAKWPIVIAHGDVIRTKYIHAGQQYRHDYVVPTTVVGIDSDGSLVRSTTGGYLAPTGETSSVAKLSDIAQVAAGWYMVPHYLVSIDSYRLKPKADIPLGGLITTIGGGLNDSDGNPITGHEMDVNAPITQIKFRFPKGDGDKQRPAVMQIKTFAGELDALPIEAAKLPPKRMFSFTGEPLRSSES